MSEPLLVPDEALSLTLRLAIEAAWLSELAHSARTRPTLHPLARLVLDAVAGNPTFKAREGRFEAWSQSAQSAPLWSIEPLSSPTFPKVGESDLVLRQRGFPGTALQLLRAVPDVKVLETEGVLRWPRVVALGRSLTFDRLGALLSGTLGPWWSTARVSNVELQAQDGALTLSLKATWKSVEPLLFFLLAPDAESAPTETPPPDPLSETVARQKREGFPALRGSSASVALAVSQEQANTLLAALLSQMQATPATLAEEETPLARPDESVPDVSLNLVRLVHAVQVAFEAQRAVLQVELNLPTEEHPTPSTGRTLA